MRETLVLIPGLLCDAAIWAAQREALGESYDIRVADLTRSASLADMARSILAETPDRLSVAGHSMGARVALEMFRAAPQRIARIALLDTGVHPVGEGEAERRAELLAISGRHGMRALADAWLPPMLGRGVSQARPELWDQLHAMVERMTPTIHRNQIAALLSRPDARDLLARISCPMLIGVGDQDAWSPPALHRAMADAVPHARYVIFPESGHMAPLEAPDAVTDALSAWMLTEAESPAGPARRDRPGWRTATPQ